MKYLFYLGHPAHFHLFKNVVSTLRSRGHAVEVAIKKKDVLEDLVRAEKWPYTNVQRRGRGDGRLRIALGLAVRDLAVLRLARRFRPHLMLGTSAEIAHVGRLTRIPSIVVNEDDWDVVPLFAKLAYPFATHVLAPTTCRVGRWAAKTIHYRGVHELAYLHPNHFTPDPAIAQQLSPDGRPYFILRFAKLNAHHDAGRTGINAALSRRLISVLEPRGHVYITAERELEPEFEPYRLRIPPSRVHDALARAHLFVGDSQTMAAEAAVLGTPAIRYNDFVGEIGYLEDLEHTWGLTEGIRTTEPERLFARIEEFARTPDLRSQWDVKRARLLHEMIDLAAFMHWLIEHYPASVSDFHADPGRQRAFLLHENLSVASPLPVISAT